MKPIKYEKNHTLYAVKALMTQEYEEITIGKLGDFFYYTNAPDSRRL